MKQFISLIITFLVVIKCFSQEPFDVLSVDKNSVRILDYSGKQDYSTYGFYSNNLISTIKFDSIPNKLDAVSQPNFNYQTNLKGFNNPSLNLKLIRYRLGIFTDTVRKIAVYLPLIIVSKFNLDYDSTNIPSLLDITSFDGSPFTFRLMPSYNYTVGDLNTITIGCIADLRTIFFRDSISKKLDLSYSFYGSIGFKYSGNGDVRAANGETQLGNWSFSGLLYGFSSNSNIFDNYYEEQKRFFKGLEFLFRFQVFNSKYMNLNLNASLQYQFNKPKDFDPLIFKIGFGN
jgi:hypothetical protein